MQHLEVSGAVRPLKWSLGVKWLSSPSTRVSRHCEMLPMKTDLFLPLVKSVTCPVYNLLVC